MTRYLCLLPILLITTLSCTRLVDSVDPKSNKWTTFESEHYRFNVRSESFAATSIEQIKQEQERAYKSVIEQLEISFDQEIRVYLYASRQDMGATNRTGKAYPDLVTIEAIYNPQLQSIGKRGISKHEISHIMAYYGWCPSSEPLFGEGLAVWLDDSWYSAQIPSTDLYQISKLRLQGKNLPTVGDMIHNWSNIPARISYPSAGAFTKYLIETYGLNPYKRLYCEARKFNFEDTFNRIYDKQIRVIETEYREFLQNY